MTPDDVAATILTALRTLTQNGTFSIDAPETVTVERPRNRDHGDWSTNVAMQLAKKAGMPPRQFADALVAELAAQPGIASADVAGPGFINLRIDAASAGDLARAICEAGDAYGRGDSLAGKNINLEFVSANPTGPVHLGGTRWAAVGDTLARIFEASGADVTREYYFNDHGAQIDRFSASLYAAAKGEPAPEDGYAGEYIHDIADRIVKAHPDVLAAPREEALETFRREGVELMFAHVKESLKDFGVVFDVYFHENDIHTSGAVTTAIERLKDAGHMYEDGGALWLRTTTFGDDKDRVVIKSDGDTAYFSGDIAYYLNKRERGFDQSIIILGADHHGYIGRMMAMCAAFGDTPGDNLQIIIGQMVNLVSGGQPVRMSKRAGTVVMLEDLVERIGVDASRYVLVRSSMNSAIDVDLDLWSSRSNENPIYYVQYAHARTCSVDRKAAEAGVTRGAGDDLAQLNTEADAELLGHLAEFPGVVATAAEYREPHRICRYLEALAGTYHRWYGHSRVCPMDGETVSAVHRARLTLNDAAQHVLANGLQLVGATAPERM